MKRVLVCSPKGGVGKTHLARNLSVAAAHAGLRVATADFDPQEALTRSWQRRPVGLAAPTHYPVSWADAEALVSPGGIEEADILFIDTPPSLHEHQDDMRTLIGAADLVLVPSKLSFDDIDSALPYLAAIRNTGQRPVVVLNMVRSRVNTAQEKAALVDAAELCPIEISDRADYTRIGVRGLSILDLPNHSGAAEIIGIWRYVRGRLGFVSLQAEAPDASKQGYVAKTPKKAAVTKSGGVRVTA